MGKKFLIIKLSSMGDVIHTLPIPYLIKKKFPDSEIDWIVEKLSFELVDSNSYVDNALLFPKEKLSKEFKKNKLEFFKDLKEYFKTIKAKNYDYALDFQGLFKSGILTYFSGANKRIGFKNGRELSPLFYNIKIEQNKKIHVIDRYIKLLSPFNIRKKEIKFDIEINEKSRNKINKVIEKNNINEKKIVILHPFTSWKTKNWALSKYKKLAEKLISNFNSKK